MKATIANRIVFVVLLAVTLNGAARAKNSPRDSQKIRADYIARIQQQTAPVPLEVAAGSLWIPGGALTNLSSDYKATQVNDLVTIVVVQKTTAQASGNVNGGRDFDTTSGISGLAGHISTSGVSNVLTAQSSTKLKGTGSTDSSSTMQTSLSGQIIAVLANGNMVVEAQRVLTINNQKETMVVRGVLRPGDISPSNTALSTSLSNLEVELKGKGVVSDFTRPPNPFVRALLWIIGF